MRRAVLGCLLLTLLNAVCRGLAAFGWATIAAAPPEEGFPDLEAAFPKVVGRPWARSGPPPGHPELVCADRRLSALESALLDGMPARFRRRRRRR